MLSCRTFYSVASSSLVPSKMLSICLSVILLLASGNCRIYRVGNLSNGHVHRLREVFKNSATMFKITYMVKLFPKESCNCQAKKDCYHILAVKIFLDMPIEKKSKSYTLTDLRKNCRSKSDKRSGRKKPRKNDINPDKNLPASDSIIMKS